jgi:hypothetical protein
MIERAERIRAALPVALAQALSAIERVIVGEDQQEAGNEARSSFVFCRNGGLSHQRAGSWYCSISGAGMLHCMVR